MGLALEPNAPTPGPDQAPGGGPPFPVPDQRSWLGKHWPILFGLGVPLAGAGAELWRGRR